jgi:hypothetical protein
VQKNKNQSDKRELELAHSETLKGITSEHKWLKLHNSIFGYLGEGDWEVSASGLGRNKMPILERLSKDFSRISYTFASLVVSDCGALANRTWAFYKIPYTMLNYHIPPREEVCRNLSS